MLVSEAEAFNPSRVVSSCSDTEFVTIYIIDAIPQRYTQLGAILYKLS